MIDQVKNRDIVFGYFWAPTENGHGRICVALKRPQKGSSSKEYKATFAFCSPLDNFSKQIGREKTLQQLQENSPTRVFTVVADENDRLKDVFIKALKQALSARKVHPKHNAPGIDTNFAPRWMFNLKGPVEFGNKWKFRSKILL